MHDEDGRQTTIRRNCQVEGVGFWSGRTVCVELRPAGPDTGLVFVRSDLTGRPRIEASVENRIEASRRTVLERGSARVEMVEHVLAALVGGGVDNCEIWLDGEELPGFDGSALPYVRALHRVGRSSLGIPASVCSIREPLEIRDGEASLRVEPPHAEEYHVAYALDCGRDSPIPPQSYAFAGDADDFARELAPARTFVTQAEANALQEQGLAGHVSTSDLLVFGPGGPIGNELRFADECARHKAMDAIGDLALVGARIQGRVVSHGGGHRLNGRLAAELHQRYIARAAVARASA